MGAPSPLNGKSAMLLWKKIPKGAENDVAVLNKVKDGLKRPKRAKNL